jgi:hypothetical protein
MAYDIARGKQIPRDISITLPARSISRNEILVLGGSAILLMNELLKKLKISTDQQEYQRRFRPGHKTTIEMPAMPMRELIGSPYTE